MLLEMVIDLFETATLIDNEQIDTEVVTGISRQWIKCHSHEVNIALKHVFDKLENEYEDINAIFECSKSVVAYYKHSTSLKLPTTLKSHVETRWNSRLTMLKSIYDTNNKVAL